jgi:hypothetical protein
MNLCSRIRIGFNFLKTLGPDPDRNMNRAHNPDKKKQINNTQAEPKIKFSQI